MNRAFGIMLAIGLSIVSFAQSNFTIRRPADGSTVRETVKIRFPRKSVPENSYVGIWINGQFLEAVTPSGPSSFEGNDFVYELDTKERGIKDGRVDIKAVLYGDFGTSGTRKMGETSIAVKVDNATSIKPPASGWRFRYSFVPGKELYYRAEIRQSASVISEAQAKMGGRAAELPRDSEVFRMLYAIDNRYPGANGTEGLLRMQATVEKDKEYAILTLAGSPEPKRYYDKDMHPLYMRITGTGREIFGRAPFYVPMQGTAGEQNRLNLYAIFPWPVLPTAGVKLGDSWQTAVSPGGVELDKMLGTEKLTQPVPARGTLEKIEWQNGRRCALIRNKLALNSGSPSDTQEYEDVFWFDIDRGQFVKMERNFVRTLRVTEQSGGAGGGAGAGGASGTGGRKGGPPGAGGRSADEFLNRPESFRQDGGERRGRGRQGLGGGAGGGGAARGGNTGGSGGGNQSRTRIFRTRVQIILNLES